MKNTDKVTLTVKQLKMLIKESEQNNKILQYGGFNLDMLDKQYKTVDNKRDELTNLLNIIANIYDIIAHEEFKNNNFDMNQFMYLKKEYNKYMKKLM